MGKKHAAKYVIALKDCNDGILHTFTDPALWELLNSEILFPYGATRVTVFIPGTTVQIMVTAGSAKNDIAQAFVTYGYFIGLREIEYKDYEEKLLKLTDKVGAANVYSGLWYSP